MLYLTAAVVLLAQWVNFPSTNTPRTPDGKPNLSAPAPKAADGKPDLSGIWRVADGRYLQNIAVELGEAPFQPWAAALYKERADALGKGRPSERCIPHGIPDGMLVRNSPFKIVQTPGVLVILYEEFNHYRQIFTDGRAFPPEANPSWFGYSIVKWEGDTFVAETIGFNDQSWLDDPGDPHSGSASRDLTFSPHRFRPVGIADHVRRSEGLYKTMERNDSIHIARRYRSD